MCFHHCLEVSVVPHFPLSEYVLLVFKHIFLKSDTLDFFCFHQWRADRERAQKQATKLKFLQLQLPPEVDPL